MESHSSDVSDLPRERFDGLSSGSEDARKVVAQHSLIFRHAWRDLFGVSPSRRTHERYCSSMLEAGVPPTPRLDPEKFLKFVSGVTFLPNLRRGMPSVTPYGKLLADNDRFAEEIEGKITERYGEAVAGNIAGDPAAGEWRIEMEATNPLTGHTLGPESAYDAPCALEYWRHMYACDYLFVNQCAAGAGVFVDGPLDDRFVASVAKIADMLGALHGGPTTVLGTRTKDVEKVVSECESFVHFGVCDARECYLGIPRIFKAFVLVGGTGDRPSLASPLAENRSWFYATSSDSRPDPSNRFLANYCVAAPSFSSCMSIQSSLQRVVYVVPHLVAPRRSGDGEPSRRDKACVHPGVKHLFPDLEAVPPHLAGSCEVYVSGPSEEGVAECLMSGGCAVGRSDIVLPGVNGVAWDPSDHGVIDRAYGIPQRDRRAVSGLYKLMHGIDTFRWLWSDIFRCHDPLLSNNPRCGEVLHDRFLILSLIMRVERMARVRSSPGSRSTVFFVDNRDCPATAISVLITMTNLAPGSWSVTGMMTDESARYFESVIGHMGIDHIPMKGFRTPNHTIEQYNRLMKSPSTWRALSDVADRALCVQSDGLIVRPGLESHEAMKREYTGAPWLAHPYLQDATRGNLVGNGGLSMRDVGAMVRACEDESAPRVYPMAPFMSEAEDVFFSRRIRDVCGHSAARAFSMEQVAFPACLGYHKFWPYHRVGFTVAFFEDLLRPPKDGHGASGASGASPEGDFSAPKVKTNLR